MLLDTDQEQKNIFKSAYEPTIVLNKITHTCNNNKMLNLKFTGYFVEISSFSYPGFESSLQCTQVFNLKNSIVAS